MKWYQKTWVIILFLFFFAPVGIILMWLCKKKWNKNLKIILSAIFAIIFIITLCSNGNDDQKTIETKASVQATTLESTLEPTPRVTVEPTSAPTPKPTTEPTLKPTSEPTQQPTPIVAAQTSNINITSITETVSQNANATISIQAQSNTAYSIYVYYASGASTAKGLESKVTDQDGKASWTWKVGGNTTPGTYEIIISDGNQTQKTYFTVVE